MTTIRTLTAQFAAALTAMTLSLALMGATVSNPQPGASTIAAKEILA